MDTTNPQVLNRRDLLRSSGVALSALGLAVLSGCGGSSGNGAGADASANTDTNESSGNTGNAGSDTGANTGDSNQSNTTTWLAGGTAAMTAAFPPASDPLDLSLGNVMCTVTGTNNYTIGPCFFDVDDYREDISEGQPGVPMTLVMKLVDGNCEPIADADIEVWWCNWEGVYSGDDSESTGSVSNFNAGFCTGNEADALAARWFRGVQRTDGAGNVYFKACFPGWYPSRTTHVHLRVVRNGVEQLVSQFCFDDDLANDIYQNHSDYTGQAKDTRNDSDTVFGSEYEDYSFVVEQQSDGSMLAYKGIQIV